MSHRKHAGTSPRHAGLPYPGQQRNPNVSVVDPHRAAAARSAELVELEYDILDGDVGDPQSDVPEEIVDEVAEVWELVHDKPAEAARRLEPLIERFPNVPRLYNFLRTAYASSGQKDKAHEIAERNFRLHPTYLFAKLDCAADAMARGEPQRVPEILGHKFDLKLMYPHRDAFHISEFVGLQGVLAEYYLQVGDLERAATCCEMLEQVDPEHPMVEVLENQLALAMVGEAMRRMASRAHRPAKKRRKRKGRGAQG
jgi:tetratricopeptide (TPR) repeat protein